MCGSRRNIVVREMFLRLQNGTTLKAQEKWNAMRGKMRNFVRQLAGSPFFHNCGFNNTRFNFDLVAAQMIAIELNGGPCHVRNTNLSKMYESEWDFDSNSAKAKKLLRVLESLTKAFPAKTPELERYSVVSLYALVSHCLEGYEAQRERFRSPCSGSLRPRPGACVTGFAFIINTDHVISLWSEGILSDILLG